MVEKRRRLREVVWFETLEERRDWTTADAVLIRVSPYLYLASVPLFPLACVLAVLGPWGTPVWPWGLLIVVSEASPRVLVSVECDSQGRSSRGFYAFRLWLWLRLGGGTRQALRTIVLNRHRTLDTQASNEPRNASR
jgi:hypothetical protein